MIDRNKVIKMLLTLTGIVLLVWGLTELSKRSSMTLEDYANENPEIAYAESTKDAEEQADTESATSSGIATSLDQTSSSVENSSDSLLTENSTENLQNLTDTEENAQETLPSPTLIGATLNGDSVKDQRITYEEAFYYEPLSDNLKRYITGISFPAVSTEVSSAKTDDSTTDAPITPNAEANVSASNSVDFGISYEDLSYVHILHYDFDGNPAEGELICNKAIAEDLVEIFYELYRNEYQLEKVLLIDEYDGDDTASMEDNNTSCFNYRVVPNSTSLSKHALGLAIDINPLYNPYITYKKDAGGNIIGENVSPESALDYADRDKAFPYKIDENDLCYKLFTEHGFTWGGNWNSCKDYQHFQKVIDF